MILFTSFEDFAAVQVPATSGGGLVSYTFLRLKSSARLQEALPMASMPSPATVLLTALGSSEAGFRMQRAPEA